MLDDGARWTFTLSTVTCGLQLSGTPVYTGSGANTASGLTFVINNSCTVTGITVDSLKFTWSGVASTQYIDSIKWGGTNVATGLSVTTGANGVVIAFSANQTLAAGGNVTITLAFGGGKKGNFTSNADSDGTPGKFSSIIAHETNVSPSSDELMNNPPVP